MAAIPETGSLQQFERHLVHLDLKGAPPKMSYLLHLLPLFRDLGATGLLVEYEDTYPYIGDLQVLRGPFVYTEEDIGEFLRQSESVGLEVVPLVQTFGHLEFVLKHDKFKKLRATPNDLTCLSSMSTDSLPLVKAMIRDMMRLHGKIRFIHLGGDEVFNLGENELDRKSGLSRGELYLHHMKPVLEFTKNSFPGVQPIIWHDMLIHISAKDLKQIADAAEPMLWEYRPDVQTFLSEEMIRVFSTVFPHIWAASAFKGATEYNTDFVPIAERVQNHASWAKILQSFPGPGKLVGIVLTGWSRYDHFASYCELLPSGIPSLGLCLATLKSGYLTDLAHRRISDQLGIRYPIPLYKSDALTLCCTDTSDSAFLGFEVYYLSMKLVKAQQKLEEGIRIEQLSGEITDQLSVDQHKIHAKEILIKYCNFKRSCNNIPFSYN
jgi:hexosaminidase